MDALHRRGAVRGSRATPAGTSRPDEITGDLGTRADPVGTGQVGIRTAATTSGVHCLQDECRDFARDSGPFDACATGSFFGQDHV